MTRAAALLSLLLSITAAAQAIVPDRELEIVRQNFNVGNYREALTRARNAMEVANFNEAQRVELHKYAGLSAFNLGEAPAAEKHFYSLLQLNPDYVLDPFAYPPPAIRLFEEVKRKNADSLNLIRQQLALREEQLRREAAEREKARLLAEEARRRLEEQAREVTVRTVEKRSLLVNFVPFGAGQFQQGRTGLGVLFASLEGAAGLLNIISYLVIDRMFVIQTIEVPYRIYPDDGIFTVTVRRIPPDLKNSRDAWGIAKVASGIAFYSLIAIGAAEALWRHKDEVVTVETRRLDAPAPATPPKPEAPKVFLFPTSGGLGAGVSLRF
ncbi:MAG: Tetratricopeptide repeat protein [Myxococcaceae bacterium]|nr:Tetratricopeptide repeat protein [Myxococcaceae bacterium]